ncbi:hypothetical protein [Winogradskyella ursingii]|uniref:hypothetical protein n=1 Tax=Winogradskyella ursingii TaxID=2686079 RepID=UPI0015C87DAB|nr:hypothetical protein [Winogradskyella ursingii]
MYSDNKYLDISNKCLEDCQSYLKKIETTELNETFITKYMECIDAAYVCIKQLSKSNAYSDEYAALCGSFGKLITQMTEKLKESQLLVSTKNP